MICATAPLVGTIVSAKASYIYGGHDKKNTLIFALVNEIVGMTIAMVIPMINDATTMLILLWFLLFTGSIHLPIMIGVMLSSVEAEMRAQANSLAIMTQAILGFAPAPTVYGLVQGMTGGKKSRWGLVAVNSTAFFTLIFTILIFINKYGTSKKIESEPW